MYVCTYIISACLCATYLCLSYIFYEFDCEYNPVETLTTSWRYSIIRYYANLTSRSIKWRVAHEVLFAVCGAQMLDDWLLLKLVGVDISSRSSDINHQYATNMCKTAVCGSSIFVCWITGEAITGCHK